MKLSGVVPIPKVSGWLILKNANGIPIRYISWNPNSYVSNFYKWLITQGLWVASHADDFLGQYATNDVYVQSPTTVNPYYDFQGDLFGSSGGLDGIVCGTGSTAEDFEDRDLDVILPNGTGANTLTYMGTTQSVIDSLAVRTVRHVRSVFNNSGGQITVAEIGFRGLASSKFYLLFRDVLDSAVVMANAEELEITMNFNITYPESIS